VAVRLASFSSISPSKRARILIASLLVLMAVASFRFFQYRAGLPSPAVIQETVGDAAIYFAADRTIVWYGGECITLSWRVEGIREIWLRSNPTTGQEERVWCLADESLAGRPALRIHFTDDTWKEYAFDVEVMQPLLLYTAVPLLVLAAWVLRLRISLPSSIRQRLTDEKRKLYWFTEPFLSHGTFNLNLVYVFLLINALVLFNAVRHNPEDGYDAAAHLAYIDALAELRLPEKRDTYEYFSPPLAYVIPAAITKIVDPAICSKTEDDCRLAILKAGQMQNIFLSVGITFFLIKLASLIRPGQTEFKVLALTLLGILPVYYKTMSFIRGEPYLVFFTIYLIYLLAVIVFSRPSFRVGTVITAGVVMGLMLLSRQWGALIIIGAMLWLVLLAIKCRVIAVKAASVALVTALIAIIVGGWFYLSLQVRFGSPVSFNRAARDYSFADHPPEFYFGLGNGALFTRPYRDAFPNQILPKFFTEIWGDYEGYFITYQYETQPDYLLSYLGRVNAVSLFPTAILLAGLGVGAFHLRRFVSLSHLEPVTMTNLLLMLCIATSLAGYMWFLVRYPSDKGDTIKPSYMLQIFPLIAILGAEFLDSIRKRKYRLYVTVMMLLGMVLLHNLPAMMTRRTDW
jgi:hypothetical protein